MLPTNTKLTQAKTWPEETKDGEVTNNQPNQYQDEDQQSNESMEDAGAAEGGEDEMTEPKGEQDLADQSSERDDQGLARSNDLKI